MCSSSKPIWPTSRPVLWLLAVVAIGLWAACPAETGQVLRDVERPPTVDLSLGPADVFEVRVYGEPELNNTYRVSPDGLIDFPLIGRVPVKGMTAAQVAETIRGRLQTFIKQPQVNVFVKEINSKKVTIYGQVHHPGSFNFVESMTLVQVISSAGGLTAMSARDRIRVTRVRDGKSDSFTVNLRDVAEGKSTFYLQPGDEIFVPERVF
jgi:polysaccharide export outer membrane protein